MDIIDHYGPYMMNRSGCNRIVLAYRSDKYFSKTDYYNTFKRSTNLFFVVEIGDGLMLYYWKKPSLVRCVNTIFNSYTDDGDYIIDCDLIQCSTTNLIDAIGVIKKKSVQTGVLLKGICQELPEAFTYNDMTLDAFPDVLKQSVISINRSKGELFHAECINDDGVMNTMTIKKHCALLDIGGTVTNFKCTLYIFMGVN